LRLRKALHLVIRYDELKQAIYERFRSLQDATRGQDQITAIHIPCLYKYFPAIQALLDDLDCRHRLTDELWKTVKDGFVGAATAFAKRVEGECAMMMGAAYRVADGVTECGAEEANDSAPDVISPVLLRGTSLFIYQGKLRSYAGILKLRGDYNTARTPDWQTADLELPEGVIGIAMALLRQLCIPETSSMLWLEKLGKQFRCDRCLSDFRHNGDAMTWMTLVWHFVKHNVDHEQRWNKRKELGVDIPLRNIYDIAKFDGKLLVSMSLEAKQMTESIPDDADETTYTKISQYTFKQWGYDTSDRYSRVYPTWAGYDTEEETPVWKEDRYHKDWSCKLCARLGIVKKYNTAAKKYYARYLYNFMTGLLIDKI